MAASQNVTISERLVGANTVALTAALVLMLVFALLVIPLLAYLCSTTYSAFEVEFPKAVVLVMNVPFWVAVLSAAVGTTALLAKERFLPANKLALFTNIACCLMVLVVGTFFTFMLSFPIFQLMDALSG